MKNALKIFIATILVFTSLVAIIPCNTFAAARRCNHCTLCCDYYDGSTRCSLCYEYYAPFYLEHHIYEWEENGKYYVVDCCGLYSEEGLVANKKSRPKSYRYRAPEEHFDIVEFGRYEQDKKDSNGEEPIQWYVLYSDRDKALLLSCFTLINQKFNEKWANVTWDNSTIRSWLNDTFYYSAFTKDERKEILTNGKSYSYQYGSYGEINTSDSVFLLSVDEVNDYMENPESRRAMATASGIAKGIKNMNGYSWWWLRNNGENNRIAQAVLENGNINTYGLDVSKNFIGVRLAIWVDASAVGLANKAGWSKNWLDYFR